MEDLARRLIPYRKWMLIAFLIIFVGAMPASVGLAVLFQKPLFLLLGSFVSAFGFTWPSGLYFISHWYDPDGGPLTPDKITTTHPFLQGYTRIMRYFGAALLAIWFFSPIVIVLSMYDMLREYI